MSDADFDFEAEQAIQLERIQEEEAARAAEARGEEQEPDWLEGVDEAATEAQNRPRRNVGRVRPEYGESSDEDDVQVAFADRSRQAGASPAPAPAGPPRPSQFLPRPPTPGGGGGGGANDARSTASTTAQRLHQTLEHVPGWAPQIMGAGIAPKAPSFTTGQTGYWVPFSSTGPFPPGVKCRPARVIDLGFVAAWQQASDAERISDMTAQTDPVARARTVATCALMGLLSVGMAKGYVASPNHSELNQAKKKDPEEFYKEVKRLDGKVKTYTYCPNATSTNLVEAMETAMMFAFVHIAMHDPEGKYVGFKILMLIFDKGFSLDELVHKVMEENALIKKSGQMNGMPEKDRTSKMERQNKLQRTQITDDNLEATAATQYKRICSNQDYLKFMQSVGGQTNGNPGRPYYANIGKDTPPGCVIHPFVKHEGDEWGGQHPIGPTVSHNHKRFAEPGHVAPDHPGINVSVAGTLDARGKPLELHESLVNPRDWYDVATGDFSPPQHVVDNGWCHICHDPSVTNIFNAPLPHKMHGNVEPEDCLLRIFWKLHKDSNPILKKAQEERGLTTFEQNRDTVLSLFHRFDDALDPDQQKLAHAVLETEMLSNDSIDKSVAEEAILERRAYGDKSLTEKHGGVHGARGAAGAARHLRGATAGPLHGRRVGQAAALGAAQRRLRRAAGAVPGLRRQGTAAAPARGARRGDVRGDQALAWSAWTTPTGAPRRARASRPATTTWRHRAQGLREGGRGDRAAPQRVQPRPPGQPERPQRARRHGQPRVRAQASRSWPPTSRPGGTGAPSLPRSSPVGSTSLGATSSSCWRCTCTRLSRTSCILNTRTHTHTHTHA